jgi:hypothetical protein
LTTQGAVNKSPEGKEVSLTIRAKVKKERITLYLDPETGSRLWQARADTRRNISEIANEILRDHFSEATKRKKPREPVAAS